MPEQHVRGRSAQGQPQSWFVCQPNVPSNRPPVVLLHGLASNASRFAEFVDTTALRAQHTLIRMDLPGHGAAITRRPVNLTVWCADVVAALQAQQQGAGVLVGHSLGAQVALHTALWHAPWVKALVLIDPVLRQALHGRSRRVARAKPLWQAAAACARAFNALGLHRGELPPLDLRALDAMARQSLATPAAHAAFVAQYSSTWADLRHVPTAVYLEDMVAMCVQAPLPRQLPQAVPVLVLQSTGAAFADAATMQAALAGPSVEFVQIECHHWPLTEKPVEVREAIERWIGRCVP
jgi:esterase